MRAIGEERDLEFLTCSLVSGVPLDTFTVSSGDVVSFLLNIRFSDVPADLVGTLGRDSRWHLPLVAGTYNVIYRSCVCRDYSEHLMSRLEREAEILRATLFTDEIESNAVQIVHDE